MASILWRHGFGPQLRILGLSRFLPSTPEREPDPTTAGLELPVRVRLACEEIGPVTIKLAQALASRPDLIPMDYVREFRRLQDQVQPFPFEAASDVIQSELHAPIDRLYEAFEEVPTASASIGQVHFASLPDGQKLAVKVQRPGLEEVVETDLQILQFAAREAEVHVGLLHDLRISEWASEFGRSLRAELDYTNEGQNTDRLRQVLAEDPKVVVPRVYWDLSSRRVLTLERIEGVHIDDVEGLRGIGVSRSMIAVHMAESILRQIYVNGFFHADPHPGNVLVQSGGRIAFLDCGNAASIGRDIRASMVHLLMGALDGDATEVCDHIIDMGAVSEDTDLQQLRLDIQRMMAQYSAVSTAEFRMGEVLEDLMAVIFRHRVRMPSVFSSVLRALIITEGTCRSLDAGFDFRVPARQIISEVMKTWVQPANIMRELWRAVRDLHRYGLMLPRQASEVLSRVQAGALKIRFDIENSDETLHRLDVMCNRVAFALVVAAIIVGSSVILASETAVATLTQPGALAYGLVGALMGLYLLYSILRSGRL
ncbi:AarF/ABC1/UbiB kinase family protein [bacterium]|nr:AarF/ABC1/UbiB kinase family protein [bacterium]